LSLFFMLSKTILISILLDFFYWNNISLWLFSFGFGFVSKFYTATQLNMKRWLIIWNKILLQSSFDITIRDITIILDIMILFSRETEFLLNKKSRFNDIFQITIFCRGTEDIVISKLDCKIENVEWHTVLNDASFVESVIQKASWQHWLDGLFPNYDKKNYIRITVGQKRITFSNLQRVLLRYHCAQQDVRKVMISIH